MPKAIRNRLSKAMTLRQFDHGYWYATEIKRFAQSVGLPSAHKLRKDDLEKAIRHFLVHGKVTIPTKRDLSRSGMKDVDRGQSLARRSIDAWGIYFLSDFMKANPGATMAAAIRAWKRVKTMDAPKNYRAFKEKR